MAPSIHCPSLFRRSSPHANHGGGNNNDDDDNKSEEQLLGLTEKDFLFMVHSEYLKRVCCNNGDIGEARAKAVSWILKVCARFCFRPETVMAAVNYLDRFLSCTEIEQEKRAWATQLASVACLSVAAKMEENHIPLLLDLQVEDADYVFEAGSVQRMELILLGALEWRMTSVTPLSYIYHGSRILGIRDQRHRRTFVSRSSEVALCAVRDGRILAFRPSVVAVAIMVCTMKEMEGSAAIVWESRLLSALKVEKAKVEECCQLIRENMHQTCMEKRSSCSLQHGSPRGVMDASFSCNSDGFSKSIVDYALKSPEYQLPAPKKMRIGDFCPSLGSSVEKAF